MPHHDHYAVLGVTEDASCEEIKAVYRQLARTFHPDVNADADAVDHFREITEAFLVLSDPEQRAAYDRKRPLARRSRRSRDEAEKEVHLGLRVAGINLGGLLGVSVNVTTRPLIDDGADEDSR